MHGFLHRACEQSRARAAAASAVEPLAALRERAESGTPPAGFAAALRRPGVAVIAEVKRASPSRGLIADIPDPAALARGYAAGGAAAVSVLTEPEHFRGSLDDLAVVAAGAGLPALRKDFLVTEFQVWEARAAGAAAVLLIVAALGCHELATLLDCAAAAGLDALVEVHDAGELELAVAAYTEAGAPVPLILGVNARNLATLHVDTGTFARVAAGAPDHALLVAESGVRRPDDVRRLADEGAGAVLVGEHVAAAADPAAAVRALATAVTVVEEMT